MSMKHMAYMEEFYNDLAKFHEMTEKFYRKEITIPEYKHFSGGFGSYAQRGGGSSMLRMRLTGGEISREILGFLSDSIEKYKISLAHLTTCQSLQLHNLNEAQVCALIQEAFDHGIITRGGGGDYPRNVMASPLSGVLPGEPFDVLPYAKEAADYLLGFINTVTLPRKLKVCFSNSPVDEVHAAFRDLGFVATKDGAFDVYCAGGLGRSPRMGLKVAAGVAPSHILYHIKAMVDTFTAYGNYENRGRARTRFLQEELGPEGLLAAYQEKLAAAQASEDLTLTAAQASEDLTLTAARASQEPTLAAARASQEPTLAAARASQEPALAPRTIDAAPSSPGAAGAAKSGHGVLTHPRAIPQKQPGLYAVFYKPAGGNVPVERFRQLFNAMADMEGTALRISPAQCLYIINCTAREAEALIDLTPDSARSTFELSMACIGAGICQVGARDSQATLKACLEAVRPFDFPDGTLPPLRISGCPSSCSAHQVAPLGFRGGVCQTPEGPRPAYALYAGGCELPGQEQFGEELGVLPEACMPDFLVELGTAIAADHSAYERWIAENRERFLELIRKYSA